MLDGIHVNLFCYYGTLKTYSVLESVFLFLFCPFFLGGGEGEWNSVYVLLP